MSETFEISIPKPKNKSAELVAAKIPSIASVLPSHIEKSAFIGSVMAELNSMTSPCSPASVVMAVWNCAVVGWIPGTALGHAYFVPFKGKCTLVPGYKGFVDLALRQKFLKSVHADVVLAGEEFRHWKDINGPQIHHEIPLDRELVKQNVVGAYCLYTTVAGGSGVAVVTRKELDKVDTGKNVWKSDYVAMAKKTPIRRAAKEWSLTKQMGLAVRLDEMADTHEVQDLGIDYDVQEEPIEAEFQLTPPESVDEIETDPNKPPEEWHGDTTN